MDFLATEWPDLAEKVVLYVTVWTKLCNHAAESLNWHKCNEEPSHRHFPLPKNHLHHNHCLRSTGLPPIKSTTTHPTPSWTSDPADVSSLPGSVPIPIPYSWSLILENDLHPADHHDYHYHHYYYHHHPLLFFFFLYMGLRRYSSVVVLKDPLYYMGWSESLSWNEKKIITENWCLGDALEPLITSGTAEVTEKCCEVSSWSSVHECCRSLSKNKWLSKIYLSLKLTGNCLWDK